MSEKFKGVIQFSNDVRIDTTIRILVICINASIEFERKNDDISIDILDIVNIHHYKLSAHHLIITNTIPISAG